MLSIVLIINKPTLLRLFRINYSRMKRILSKTNYSVCQIYQSINSWCIRVVIFAFTGCRSSVYVPCVIDCLFVCECHWFVIEVGSNSSFFLSRLWIGCKTKELVKITCDNCRLTFCLKHRHESDHECAGRSQGGSRSSPAANKAGAAAMHRFQSSQNSQQVSCYLPSQG